MSTPQDLDENLRSRIEEFAVPDGERPDPAAPLRDGSLLTGDLARQVLEAQFASRHLDLAARWLGSFDAGFYTVGSSGHEGNAALAAALRPTDPALLHYRSCGFYCVRAAQVTGVDPVADVLRGLVASSAEPGSGGRDKVFGSQALNIVPVPAAGGGHLPRAVGAASALGGGRTTWPEDALVVCSFGDATINHAPATAALNAAGWLERSGAKLPLLLVCEDNGFGVSTRSPDGWVADTLRFRPGLRYFAADGCDPVATYDAAERAASWVRKHRRPAVLHLTMIRLMGHSGADQEQLYRTVGEISADLARDPVVATARALVDAGLATPEELLARYDEIGWQVRRTAEEVIAEPRLTSATEVIAPLSPRRPVGVSRQVADAAATAGAEEAGRPDAFGGRLPEEAGPLTLARTIGATLTDGLLGHPQMILFGADVAARGGDNGVTRGLRDHFDSSRVFDTIADETSLLGLGLGAGSGGLLPVLEIRGLAQLHAAQQQLRAEAAPLQFRSNGAFRNPMVIRVPGLAHPGAGGGGADDSALAGLRDIPGLVVAVPARAEDAAPLLRTCLASAAVDGTVAVVVEPVALYQTTDLYAEGDGLWQAAYAPPADWAAAHVPIGRARVYTEGSGADLTVLTFGEGVRLSLRAARRLAGDGVGTRVVDLRWLAPLPLADIMREASATGRVLVVDGTRRSGGVGEGVLAVLVDAGYVGAARRLAAIDSFVPLGPAAEHVLVGEEQIMQGARSLLAH